VKLTTHHHVMSNLRMGGVIPLLLVMCLDGLDRDRLTYEGLGVLVTSLWRLRAGYCSGSAVVFHYGGAGFESAATLGAPMYRGFACTLTCRHIT
jgi:hypothetical protein